MISSDTPWADMVFRGLRILLKVSADSAIFSVIFLADDLALTPTPRAKEIILRWRFESHSKRHTMAGVVKLRFPSGNPALHATGREPNQERVWIHARAVGDGGKWNKPLIPLLDSLYKRPPVLAVREAEKS